MEPIFVALAREDGGTDFFAGSLAGIMADTDGGRSFAFTRYTAYRVVTEAVVRLAGATEYLDRAIEAVRLRNCASYFIDSIRPARAAVQPVAAAA